MAVEAVGTVTARESLVIGQELLGADHLFDDPHRLPAEGMR